MIYLSQNEDKLICQFRNRKYIFFVKLFKHRKMYEKQHNSYLFWKKSNICIKYHIIKSIHWSTCGLKFVKWFSKKENLIIA